MTMNNWETILISPQASLSDAMEALDRGGLQIVVVVDEHFHVMGTLTDGDIRRALLRQLPITTLAGEIMNRSPETALESTSKEEVKARMERRRLLQIPIVSEQGRIVAVQTLHDLLHPTLRDNAVFIMAGGFGKRLQLWLLRPQGLQGLSRRLAASNGFSTRGTTQAALAACV